MSAWREWCWRVACALRARLRGESASSTLFLVRCMVACTRTQGLQKLIPIRYII